MLAVRKINNNVVVCKDGNGRELIAMGKGLGFGQLPREVALADIERSFYDVDAQHQAFVPELPPEVLSFAARIVDIAANELPYELSPNLVISLADHINFAMERTRKQITVRMPLAYDVEQTYPLEYRIGANALRRIQKEFKITLPSSEAAGIALNLLNGRADSPENASAALDDEEMLENITEIVENHFHIIVDRDAFHYSRYATHMQYLFQRIRTGNALDSDNRELYDSLKEKIPGTADCVELIAHYLQKKWQHPLSQEEKLYLMLHVNRICIKEGL